MSPNRGLSGKEVSGIMQDHYQILRIGRTASPEEIEEAYQARLRELELSQSIEKVPREQLDEAARDVHEAYTVLSDPDKRLAYHTQSSQRSLRDTLENDSPDILRYIEDQSSIYNERAIDFFRQKRLAEAITEWRRAIEVTPDVAELHHNLGNAYARQGALREAIDSWEQALQISPDLAEACNNLGYAYYKLDNLPEARKQWEDALRINPNCSQAKRNLKLLERRMGITEATLRGGEEAMHQDAELLTPRISRQPQAAKQQSWWKSMLSKLDRRRKS